MSFACALARCRAGISIATNNTVMAITTKSSIKVNPVMGLAILRRNPTRSSGTFRIRLTSNGAKPLDLAIVTPLASIAISPFTCKMRKMDFLSRLAVSCSAGYYTLSLMLLQSLSCKSGSYNIDDSRLFQPFIRTITLRRPSRRYTGFCAYLTNGGILPDSSGSRL